MNYVIWLLMRYPYIAGHAYLFLTDSLILAIIFILKDLNQNLTSKFQRNDINCEIFYRKMYWYHIRMNTIKDDRNKEDKNDLIQVEKCYVCWFYCASKIIAVVSKESTFIFFCQNKNWYKTFKSILYQYHVSFMSFIQADSHQFGVIIFGSLSTNTNQYKSFRQ